MAHAIDLSSTCSTLLFTLSGGLPPAIAVHFVSIAWGWLLCLGRPTVTNLLRAMPEKFERHWTCAHRFFSKYDWSIDALWRILVCKLIEPLLPSGQPWLVAVDDTTAHKFGKHVAFAGKFRDAVRSTAAQTVFHWAHNWVVLCLLVPIPAARGRFLHLPISLRLYKKETDCDSRSEFRTRLQLAAEMIQRLREWLPHREIQLVADGAYAAKELTGALPPGIPLISRLRSDAALYELPPARRKKQRGRPRAKGARLPSLKSIARQTQFSRHFIWRYGRKELVLLHSFVCLWYTVAATSPIRVVIVRDPCGHEHDGYFLSTDPNLSATAIVQAYAARWGIEELIREAKQSMAFEQVQSWSPKAVERQAPMALLLQAVTQLAYIQTHQLLSAQPKPTDEPVPIPSFARMLTALRIAKWQERISSALRLSADRKKILRPLQALLATAG
jgi:hypothetical protein